MKEILVTSAFPRSGSTYLNQALNLLYYPLEQVNGNNHTVKAIEQRNKTIVPFRNPLDSISSWHKYPSLGNIEADIKYYIRFYTGINDNLNKIVLMDFDYFTKSIDYIKDIVLKNFGLSSNRYVTTSLVKEAMIQNNKIINLPRDDEEERNKVKEILQNANGFSKCLELYFELKGISLG